MPGRKTSTPEANGLIVNGKFKPLPKPVASPTLKPTPPVPVAESATAHLLPEFAEDLPSTPIDMGFFTLPEFQARMRIDDPKNIRKATIRKGCPHFKIGRTTCFNRELFIEWTKEISIRTTPVTVVPAPTVKQIVDASPAAKV